MNVFCFGGEGGYDIECGLVEWEMFIRDWVWGFIPLAGIFFFFQFFMLFFYFFKKRPQPWPL